MAAPYAVLLDEAGNATRHPLVDCGALVHAIRSARGAGEGEGRAEAAARIGREMVSALIARGYFFADADSVLPLALMKQTYAQMSLAHDEISDDVKAAMTGLDRSRLQWSPQGNEDEYEPGTKATAQHWSFSRTGPVGQLDTPEEESLVGFDAFADRLYAAQDLLADAVMAGVAAGLGLPLDEFSRHVSKLPSRCLPVFNLVSQRIVQLVVCSQIAAETTGFSYVHVHVVAWW